MFCDAWLIHFNTSQLLSTSCDHNHDLWKKIKPCLLEINSTSVIPLLQICLSPSRGKEETSKSPADDKFLRQTDHMKIHEIPTRENGTTDLDQSSSSKFEESWPSTERAMVSTPEGDAESSGLSKTPSSEGTDIPFQPLPDSTLARCGDSFAVSKRREKNQPTNTTRQYWWKETARMSEPTLPICPNVPPSPSSKRREETSRSPE